MPKGGCKVIVLTSVMNDMASPEHVPFMREAVDPIVAILHGNKTGAPIQNIYFLRSDGEVRADIGIREESKATEEHLFGHLLIRADHD